MSGRACDILMKVSQVVDSVQWFISPRIILGASGYCLEPLYYLVDKFTGNTFICLQMDVHKCDKQVRKLSGQITRA